VAATVLAGVLAMGVFYSDALTYRVVRLAPIDRMQAMEDVAQRARGHGLVLHNEAEEWAKYFYRSARVDSPLEPWWGPRGVGLRTEVFQLGAQYDLDAQTLAFLTSFPAIVTRRGPDVSRPPANFHSVYRNRYYELWLRDRRTRVLDHLPGQAQFSAQARIPCSKILSLARRSTNGQGLMAAERPPQVVMRPADARDRPPLGWPPSPTGTFVPLTPGRASQVLEVPAGRYRVWAYGSSGRPIRVLIDGRVVGSFKAVNTPGQWIDVSQTAIAAGRHRIELLRPGGSLAPGDAYSGVLGPVVLEPLQPERVASVPPSQARSLCGRPLDWVERVVPGQPEGSATAGASHRQAASSAIQ
jgi:hypothetical protein